MLQTQQIPQYQDPYGAEDWHRFLSKACKGSVKATDILSIAVMAYMVALTGDATSPETMQESDYHNLLRHRFPAQPPVDDVQQFHDIAVNAKWFPHSFRVSEAPRNTPDKYVALWGRQTVAWSALVNDSMLHCLNHWSADHFLQCEDDGSLDYDARNVVTSMLYLSLT